MENVHHFERNFFLDLVDFDFLVENIFFGNNFINFFLQNVNICDRKNMLKLNEKNNVNYAKEKFK